MLRFRYVGASVLCVSVNATAWKITHCQEEKTRNVLVFGKSAVGKTSIANVLTNSDHPTGNKLKGTSGALLMDFTPYSFGGIRYKLVDSCGLNGAADAVVDHEEAVARIAKVAKETKKSGLGLIVMVKGETPLDTADIKNKKILQKMFPGVPVVIIFNGISAELKEAEGDIKDQLSSKDFKFKDYLVIPMKTKKEMRAYRLSFQRFIAKNSVDNVVVPEVDWIINLARTLLFISAASKAVGTTIPEPYLVSVLTTIGLATGAIGEVMKKLREAGEI